MRYLGSAEYDVRPGRNEVHERHFFQLSTPAAAPEEWVWHETHDGLQTRTAFSFRWRPLRQGHVLAAGMGALLSRVE